MTNIDSRTFRTKNHTSSNFTDTSTCSGGVEMATFTLNRMHLLCRNAHCRSFFAGFIQRAQLSTLESVRNNEQCKLEYLGGENNGTKPWLLKMSVASIYVWFALYTTLYSNSFKYLDIFHNVEVCKNMILRFG